MPLWWLHSDIYNIQWQAVLLLHKFFWIPMPRLLKDLQINDVSSVDRGAGVGVKVLLMKRDDSPDDVDKREFSQEERDKAASSGAALPDGSFPIHNKSDLSNAVRAIGRAKDRGKAMAHIKSRARALGASDMLPDTWSKRDSDEIEIDMTGLLGKKETTMTAEEFKKAVDDAVGAAMKDTSERIAKQETENADLKAQVAFLSMPTAYQEFAKSMPDEQKKAFAAKDKKEQDEEMAEEAKKRAEKIDPSIAKRLAEADEDRKILKQLQEKDEKITFAKRAIDLGLPEDKGEILRKAHRGDTDALKQIEDMIGSMQKAMVEAQRTGQIFNEFGKASEKSGSTALDLLNAKAAELRKTEKGLTEQQAFAKVYNDPANKDLLQQEKAERYRSSGIAA